MTPVAGDDRQRVRDAAFRLLAVRARSAKELRDRLKQKSFSPGLIDETLADFQAKGYQSDEEFARLFANEKWTRSGWGPSRVRRELGARGIAPELIDRVVGVTFGEVDLIAGIMPLAQKRWRSTAGLPLDKRRNRLTGFLQRRGYDWGTISQVLSKIIAGPES